MGEIIKKLSKNLTIFSILILIISFLLIKYTDYKIQNSKERYTTQHQIEYVNKMNNLFPNGTVTAEGWSRHPIWIYKREYINSNSIFIKEWDYYTMFIPKENIWVSTTLSDLGFGSLISISFIDINLKKYTKIEDISLLTLGKLNLRSNSLDEHILTHKSDKMSIIISVEKEIINIKINSDKIKLPNGQIGINIDINFIRPRNMESINIQTTWAHNRKLFYLNEKVVGMIEKDGFYQFGKKNKNNLKNNENEKIFLILDWGRGVWAYRGTWYWTAGSGYINGKKIGFNFGYGFSDRSPATENCLFYEDKLHKINNVKFIIPDNEEIFCDEKKPWSIISDDNRVNLIFHPKVDRMSRINYLLIKSIQDQVFGIFEGKVVLDDGTIIQINNLNGFAEKVYNRW